jgi:hypothetical protein
MVECKNCGICFRDSFNLSKHMLRKIPCSKNFKNLQNKNSQKDTLNSQKDTFSPQKDTLDSQKDTLSNCKFCLKHFSNTYNLKRHQIICKDREDPVRLLEIEKCVKPRTSICKTECRFCNKDFSRTSILNKHYSFCKDREDYHKNLLSIEKQATTINNYYGTVNNNVNNLICNVGEENIEHITNREFLSLVNKFTKKIKNINNVKELKSIQSKLIIDFGKLINKHPENKNSWLTNVKSDFGVVKRNNEEQLLRFPDFVEQILINTTKKLSDRHDTFSENHDLDDESNELLNETYEFQNGAEHYQDLSKKHLKELNDSIRISYVKK